MSTVGDHTQINQEEELQNELAIANQLLRLISIELEEIKQMTNPGSELESSIKQNAAVMKTLANLQHIDINNLAPVRKENQGLLSLHNNSNVLHSESNTSRNEFVMDES